MHNDLVRQLEPQEVASVATLALHFGLADTTDVVGWADSVIADADDPPRWAIELALARPENVQELLQQIPGERDEDLARWVFLALMRHHRRAGRLSIREVQVIGRQLYFMAAESIVWGIVLDDEVEAFEQGHLSEADLQTAIAEHLSPYARFDPLLPAWLIRPKKQLDARLHQNAHEAVHDVLIHDWDPIGVGNAPKAQDEYDAYIPGVLCMVTEGHDDQEIADYLEQIETDRMGLAPGEGTAKRNRRVARLLREAVTPFLGR